MPSFYWAVLHNWLYFLSLGFNAINMAFLCRQIADGTLKASPASIALSGNIEAVDKLLTLAGAMALPASGTWPGDGFAHSKTADDS